MKKYVFLGIAALAVVSFLFYSRPVEKPKILFLGNSITAYGASPEIGWNGVWGMAASEQQYDYVHMVLKAVAHSDFKVKTMEGWEQGFYKYNYEQLKELKDFKPDILIYQGGENTPPSLAEEKNYKASVKQLIDYIGAKKVVVVSEFWPEPVKYQLMNSLCRENDYEFADISKAMFQDGATAVKQYGNTAVGMHPSDTGMKLIADEVIKHLD